MKLVAAVPAIAPAATGTFSAKDEGERRRKRNANKHGKWPLSDRRDKITEELHAAGYGKTGAGL